MANKLPLKADHVGSFLRTEPLVRARKLFKEDEITRNQLTTVEDQEIEGLVKKQIDSGLKAVTDGDFRRSYWHSDFFYGLNGLERVILEQGVEFADGSRVQAENYEIVGKITGDNHPLVEHFKFLKNKVGELGDGSQVAKFTIPAPGVIMYRQVNDVEKEIYPDSRELFRDLGRAYKQVVKELYDAGCRYLQFDETTLTTFNDPDFTSHMIKASGLSKEEILDAIVEATNIALSDKPSDMLSTVHMCRGNFKSMHMHADGDYGYVAPAFPKLAYDAFFLEYDDHRSGGFEPLKHLQDTDKTAVIGIFTSKAGKLEDTDLIKQRIDEANQFLPLKQLAVSPQCGFASSEEGNLLTEEEQWNKVKHVIKIADSVWDKVPPTK